jgi:hypothetical protein
MCYAGPVFHHVCMAAGHFVIHLTFIVVISLAKSYFAAY